VYSDEDLHMSIQINYIHNKEKSHTQSYYISQVIKIKVKRRDSNHTNYLICQVKAQIKVNKSQIAERLSNGGRKTS
jgi:hypothetical protein